MVKTGLLWLVEDVMMLFSLLQVILFLQSGSGIGFRRSLDGGQTFTAFGTGLGTGSRIHFDLCLATSNVYVCFSLWKQ